MFPKKIKEFPVNIEEFPFCAIRILLFNFTKAKLLKPNPSVISPIRIILGKGYIFEEKI